MRMSSKFKAVIVKIWGSRFSLLILSFLLVSIICTIPSLCSAMRASQTVNVRVCERMCCRSKWWLTECYSDAKSPHVRSIWLFPRNTPRKISVKKKHTKTKTNGDKKDTTSESILHRISWAIKTKTKQRENVWFNLKIRTNFALFFRNLNRKTHRQRTNDRCPFDGIRIWCDNQNICSFGVFGIFVVINLSLCVSMGMSLRARVHVATTKDHLFWLLLPECPSMGSYVRACDKRLNNMRQPKRIIGVWLSIFELNPHERTKNDAVEMRHVYMCNACPHIEFVWQNSMLLKFKVIPLIFVFHCKRHFIFVFSVEISFQILS